MNVGMILMHPRRRSDRSKYLHVEAVRDDFGFIFGIAKRCMRAARRYGTTDDACRDMAGEARTGPRREKNGALISTGFEVTVVNTPDHGRFSKEARCQTANQISVIHPSLDDVRLRSAEPGYKPRQVP